MDRATKLLRLNPLLVRIAALIPATGAALGIYGYLNEARTRYWVGMDTQQTVANITKQRDHGVVEYRYSVHHIDHAGADRGNFATPTHIQPRPGDSVPVFYSASHPGLSSLTPPTDEHMAVWYGWPWLVMAVCMELFILSIVVYPRWFIRFAERMQRRANTR